MRHGTHGFPSEERRAEDFFRPKNPTTSAGFEPANLGIKGQHATPRPPNLMIIIVKIIMMKILCSVNLSFL